MSLWFAYNGAEYYPRAQVVEADTAEQAAEAVRDEWSDDPIAVFPFEALAYRHDGDQGNEWLEL